MKSGLKYLRHAKNLRVHAGNGSNDTCVMASRKIVTAERDDYISRFRFRVFRLFRGCLLRFLFESQLRCEDGWLVHDIAPCWSSAT
jgi:hypothetical protein